MPTIFKLFKEKRYIFAPPIAQVAELVDASDSKSDFFGSVGSIPTLSTN